MKCISTHQLYHKAKSESWLVCARTAEVKPYLKFQAFNSISGGFQFAFLESSLNEENVCVLGLFLL